MTKKTNKARKVSISQRLRSIIATAGHIGLNSGTAFQVAVKMARAIGNGNKAALNEAGLLYKAGYVAARLRDNRKSWGNLGDDQLIDAGREVYAKANPESAKPNRRTAEEHKACRAADVSWHTARANAGLVAKVQRKPRPAANAKAPPPVDLVKASPSFKTKAAANDYFATAIAALLTTVNKNAKLISPQISSMVQDAHAAAVKAGLIASRKRK